MVDLHVSLSTLNTNTSWQLSIDVDVVDGVIAWRIDGFGDR